MNATDFECKDRKEKQIAIVMAKRDGIPKESITDLEKGGKFVRVEDKYADKFEKCLKEARKKVSEGNDAS